MSEPTIDFEVRRDDLRQCRFATGTTSDLAPDEVLLRLDTIAFTANNVTYAVFGEMMRYWDFFPAPPGWGRVPVWGFADVVRSRHTAVPERERFYGYFPMSTHLVVRPAHANDAGFVDGTAHRHDLPPVYNHYVRTAADPRHDPRHEAAQMVLRPLFTTSFLIDDFLAEHDFHGARLIVLSSASSKTSIGLAFQLAQREGRAYQVVGLTSERHAAFVQGLGTYDRVLTYDALDQLPQGVPLVFVDMAGNGAVRDAVHRRAGDQVRFSCSVGGTHWNALAMAPAADLPGATPTFFFAPDRIRQRSAEWGMDGLMARVGAAWHRFAGPLEGWLKIRRGQGQAEVERVYLAMVDGKADPAEGHVLSL
jgi:hypothetical protein